jgi:hypothetical protein
MHSPGSAPTPTYIYPVIDCAKHLTAFIFTMPYEVGYQSHPHFIDEEICSERAGNLFKVTELINGGARIPNQTV